MLTCTGLMLAGEKQPYLNSVRKLRQMVRSVLISHALRFLIIGLYSRTLLKRVIDNFQVNDMLCDFVNDTNLVTSSANIGKRRLLY